MCRSFTNYKTNNRKLRTRCAVERTLPKVLREGEAISKRKERETRSPRSKHVKRLKFTLLYCPSRTGSCLGKRVNKEGHLSNNWTGSGESFRSVVTLTGTSDSRPRLRVWPLWSSREGPRQSSGYQTKGQREELRGGSLGLSDYSLSLGTLRKGSTTDGPLRDWVVSTPESIRVDPLPGSSCPRFRIFITL